MRIVIKILLLSIGAVLIITYVKIFRVVSSSMEPSVKLDSLTLVVKSSFVKKYRVNDIIVYKMPQFPIPITHRIKRVVKIHNKIFFITKGDNNSFEDSYPVSMNEVAGKVLFSIPYLIPVYKRISSYKLLFLTFYTPIGLIIGKTYRSHKEV